MWRRNDNLRLGPTSSAIAQSIKKAIYVIGFFVIFDHLIECHVFLGGLELHIVGNDSQAHILLIFVVLVFLEIFLDIFPVVIVALVPNEFGHSTMNIREHIAPLNES